MWYSGGTCRCMPIHSKISGTWYQTKDLESGLDAGGLSPRAPATRQLSTATTDSYARVSQLVHWSVRGAAGLSVCVRQRPAQHREWSAG